jgi:hypothetical protein
MNNPALQDFDLRRQRVRVELAEVSEQLLGVQAWCKA